MRAAVGRGYADLDCAWPYGNSQSASGVDDVAVKLSGFVSVAGHGDEGVSQDGDVALTREKEDVRLTDQVHVLSDQLAAAARSFEAETGKQDLLSRGVAIATEIFSGCDYAGVSIVHRKGVIDTPAATNEAVRLLDELQFALKEGPCFDAIWSGETVHVADLARDPRWPRWGPQVVADLGVASMLSYRLFTTGETLGALNLYSRSLDAFDPDDVNNGYALAAHLAIAIAGADTTEQLTSAIASRTAIGQAEGILMERFDLQPAQAFAVLARISQHSNVRLHLVALELVKTRKLPETSKP